MPHLIPITNREMLREAGCYIETNTLRKWHSRNTYPGLIVKLGNRLFLNVDMLQKIVDKQVLQQKKKAKKIQTIIQGSF